MTPIDFNKFQVFIFISAILFLSQNHAFPQLFGPQQQITGGDLTNVSTVYSDELNNDDKPDVIASSRYKIVWYKNQGEGNFDFQKTIADGFDGVNSVTADFDGDGDIDLAYASNSNHIIAWYENDGIGNFETQHTISLATINTVCINSTDMDFDGDMDLLLISINPNRVIMFKNDGTGNFTSIQVLLTVEDRIYNFGVSDMDDDGDEDILITFRSIFVWYENNGNGIFELEHTITECEVIAFYLNDMNGDQNKDILYVSSDENEIAWFENEGNGVFGIKHIVDDNISPLRDVCSIDFDNDGDNDVLVGTYDHYGIFWYENEGDGSFGEMQMIYEAQGIVALFPRDFDDDGYADFAAAIQVDGSRIVWFKNQGDNTFSDPLLLTTKTKGARDVCAADLDGDGDNEIISASLQDGKIAMYENISYQSFGSQNVIFEQNYSAGQISIVSCDLDNDTDLDIIGSYWLGNPSILWLENNGLGKFDSTVVIISFAEVDDVCSEDLDGDGDIDVLTATYEGIQWYENYGNGNFGTKQTIEWIYDYNNSVFASDLDDDHDIDVLFSTTYGKNIAYYKNDGTGNFSDRTSIYTGGTPRDVWAIDLNNDGSIDIIAAVNHKVIWFENLGNGSFGTEQLISDNVYSPRSLFSTDLDNDGYNDLLYGYSSNVIWHKNLENGTFGDQQIITDIASGVRSIFASDVDNDGDMDVLSASNSDGKIAWHENLLITSDSEEIDCITNAIQIYPNPIDNWFNIQSPIFENGNYTCELIDMYGRLIKRIDIPKGQISIKVDIGNLQKGMYIIRLNGTQINNKNYKLIKN